MRRVLTLSETHDLDARSFEMEFQDSNGLARASHVPTLHAPTVHLPAPSLAPAGTPIRQVERLHLEKTLALTDGNRTVAAEMLGISLRTLRNKIREYGLPPRRYA
jgi:DNA-binding NtrC family response regulator